MLRKLPDQPSIVLHFVVPLGGGITLERLSCAAAGSCWESACFVGENISWLEVRLCKSQSLHELHSGRSLAWQLLGPIGFQISTVGDDEERTFHEGYERGVYT